MFDCHRCGTSAPRFTVSQTRCQPCQREVDRLIAVDEARRTRVVWRAGDVTPYSGRVAA